MSNGKQLYFFFFGMYCTVVFFFSERICTFVLFLALSRLFQRVAEMKKKFEDDRQRDVSFVVSRGQFIRLKGRAGQSGPL